MTPVRKPALAGILFAVSAADAPMAAASRKYTGAPITLNLKDADLRDVIATFGNGAAGPLSVPPMVTQ